jgi:imidazole glycerol-phosphate synthase subunit HisF
VNIRLIARLDIKGPNLIKGIQMEGLRVIGDPFEHALRYYHQGVDELLYIDAVASLYQRNSLDDLVSKTVKNTFVPLTVGGGIRSVENVESLLRSGADKVAVNTAAVKNPELLKLISRRFGSQCLVLSIQSKNIKPGSWEVYTEGGREHSGKDVVEWVKEAVSLGVGEILITSVDQDGTKKGMDIELIKTISNNVSVPVIAGSGIGSPSHLIDAVKLGCADAVAVASVLHYNDFDLKTLRKAAKMNRIPMRKFEFNE